MSEMATFIQAQKRRNIFKKNTNIIRMILTQLKISLNMRRPKAVYQVMLIESFAQTKKPLIAKLG